jgi:hypothetical protein
MPVQIYLYVAEKRKTVLGLSYNAWQELCFRMEMERIQMGILWNKLKANRIFPVPLLIFLQIEKLPGVQYLGSFYFK